ncbi:unnamed protein product [Dimorphilus gyrociliatus]|uniref:Uncharacterized protein n=1 Tax=Dimorphilus gyrociliatus TaxID=2664684 RepID=A0A7I8V4C5_9ANNE|nr:unnamed protein product [Dimorphilus gyrociliatus]
MENSHRQDTIAQQTTLENAFRMKIKNERSMAQMRSEIFKLKKQIQRERIHNYLNKFEWTKIKDELCELRAKDKFLKATMNDTNKVKVTMRARNFKLTQESDEIRQDIEKIEKEGIDISDLKQIYGFHNFDYADQAKRKVESIVGF